MADRETIEKLISERFPGDVQRLELNPPQIAVSVNPEQIIPFFEFISSHPDLALNYLSAVSAVDKNDHLELVYHISSIAFKHTLAAKVRIERIGGRIDTISKIIPCANWFEREIWELFGVEFVGHPNLTRFLLAEDWSEGHPMLRDWQGKNFEKLPES